MQTAKSVVMMGLGYIGLPTAALIASKGIAVRGVDVNDDVVRTINEGKIHIVEPDLEGLVHYGVARGFLTAHTTPAAADIFLLAVPTPFRDGHRPDISFVETATDMIVPHLRPGNLVILESTSPVGTTERIAERIFSQRPELRGRLSITYCPERVLPGKILFELERNDRAIGGLDEPSSEAARIFYGQFVKGKLHVTNARTAEMCKLTENAFRDVNIAFANEIASICERLRIDPWQLISLANLHPRVNILQPGPGVGGHCIAVDPWFIVSSAPDLAQLIKNARSINDAKPHRVVEKVCDAANGLSDPVIACFGLAFKANIDDLRESPAVTIVQELAARNAGAILAVEPNISALPDSLSKSSTIRLVDAETALLNARVLVLLVDHKEFLELDPASFTGKIIIDTRGAWTSRRSDG